MHNVHALSLGASWEQFRASFQCNLELGVANSGDQYIMYMRSAFPNAPTGRTNAGGKGREQRTKKRLLCINIYIYIYICGAHHFQHPRLDAIEPGQDHSCVLLLLDQREADSVRQPIGLNITKQNAEQNAEHNTKVRLCNAE